MVRISAAWRGLNLPPTRTSKTQALISWINQPKQYMCSDNNELDMPVIGILDNVLNSQHLPSQIMNDRFIY